MTTSSSSLAILHRLQRIADVRRQYLEQLVEVVGDDLGRRGQADQARILGILHRHLI